MNAEQRVPMRVSDRRPSRWLDDLGVRATSITSVLVVFAIVLYAVLRIAYSVFYRRFGLSPDDLGLSYADLVAQSAVGVVLLLAVMLLCAGCVFLCFAAYGAFQVTALALAGSAARVSDDLSDEQLYEIVNEAEKRVLRLGGVAEWAYNMVSRRAFRMGEWVGRREAQDPKGSWTAIVRWLAPLWFFVLQPLAIVVLFVVVLRLSDVVLSLLPGIAYDIVTSTLVLLFLAAAVSGGFRVVARGLRSSRARWWRLGIAGAGLAVLLTACVLLVEVALHDRTQVWRGHDASFTMLGFSITGWHSQGAKFFWAGPAPAADITPLAGRCLMYFGQSGGTAFFYRRKTHETLRIPADDIVVHTSGSECKGQVPLV